MKFDGFDEIAFGELTRELPMFYEAYLRCKKAEAKLHSAPNADEKSAAITEARDAFGDLQAVCQILPSKVDLVLESLRSLYHEYGVFGEQKLASVRTNVYKCVFGDPYDNSEEPTTEENVIESVSENKNE